mmetsp:Transcript_29013/g.42636  ORF Transcript_29013/g.42636 Transcript_29013/m.42636 type:complete len:219 (-) Transcript_29013:440-1096(-)
MTQTDQVGSVKSHQARCRYLPLSRRIFLTLQRLRRLLLHKISVPRPRPHSCLHSLRIVWVHRPRLRSYSLSLRTGSVSYPRSLFLPPDLPCHRQRPKSSNLQTRPQFLPIYPSILPPSKIDHLIFYPAAHFPIRYYYYYYSLIHLPRLLANPVPPPCPQDQLHYYEMDQLDFLRALSSAHQRPGPPRSRCPRRTRLLMLQISLASLRHQEPDYYRPTH